MHDGGTYSHDALFFGSDETLVEACTPFISQGIADDDVVLVHGTGREVALLCAAFDDDPRVTFTPGNGLLTTVMGAIGGYQYLCDQEKANGRGVRATGTIPFGDEPVTRRDWMRYEALLDRALAPYAFGGLCRYDTRHTSDELLSWALATHRRVITSVGARPGTRTVDVGMLLAELDRHDAVDPLELIPPMVGIRCSTPAPGRAAVWQTLRQFGVDADRAEQFVSAVTEVLTNAFQHAEPPSEVRLHTDGRRWLCVVTDQGPGIVDPYAGIDSPLLGNPANPGAGLWMARHYCDRLTIANGPQGATVRLLLDP